MYQIKKCDRLCIRYHAHFPILTLGADLRQNGRGRFASPVDLRPHTHIKKLSHYTEWNFWQNCSLDFISSKFSGLTSDHPFKSKGLFLKIFNFCYNGNCDRIISRANQKLGMLRRTCNFFDDVKRRRILYFTLV